MIDLSPAIIWAIIGIVLIIFEIFTTTFFLLFFGISALLVAGLKSFGFDNVALEIFLFALLGISGTFVFRGKILSSFKGNKELRNDIGQSITITNPIPKGKKGQIEYRGSTWTAINNSDSDFEPEDNAIIERIEGVKIILTKSS
ncbi:MAG: NfeD family protein [Deltaproteobacteria bacterium]|nr:NfeD family protein [Deltaproteobacteria bacterium]